MSEAKKEKDPTKMDLEKVRKSLRDTRLTGMGLFNKVNAETKAYLDNIKQRSEDKLEEISDADSEKLFDRISVSLARGINVSRAYGVATYEEANANGRRVIDWVEAAVEEAKDDSTPDDESSKLAQNIDQVRAVMKKLTKDVSVSTESFFDDAKELGKDADHQLRKVLYGQQAAFDNRVQSLWKALGLVNKQELADLNRKLVALAESLETQLTDENKNLAYLNRRKQDRRQQQVPVDIEKRVHNRRETDREKLAS